jgi:hypothetical protein
MSKREFVNFFETLNGDGVSEPPAGADTSGLPPVKDASSTPEELQAHIDAELNLPHPPTNTGADDNANTNDTKAVQSADEAKAGSDGAGKTDDQVTATDDKGADQGAGEKKPDEVKPPEAKTDEKPADTTPEVPADLKLTVEDAAGTKYEITKIEDLPEDFVPKNNRQILEIIKGLDGLESRREAYEANQTTEKIKADRLAAEQAQTTAWQNEIDELQKSGRLDKPKIAQGADGFLEDPAIKRMDAVFQYMVEVNTARAAAGNPNRLTSFTDALAQVELKEMREAETARQNDEAETAKAKAGMVGKGNAPAASGPKPYHSGQYSSIHDIPV